MSHGDQLSEPPPGFHVIGHTKSAPFAAIAHNTKPLYGIQFHPEVTHSPRGKEVISRFVLNVCGCKKDWTMVRYLRHITSHHTFLTCTTGRVYRKGDCAHPRNLR
jgi:GMP synthase (glutamine-hydrolysing)